MGRYREFVRLVVRCRSRGQLKARLDSSDLVQETFVRAVEKFSQFAGTEEEEWRAWLGRIAEREVIHQLRHHLGAEKRAVSRERRLPVGDGSSITGSPRLDEWLVKTQSTPSRVAIRQERAALLANALARLPEDYREVLVLRNLQGLDFPDVAQRLGRSAGAVRVLWVRALKKLREELAQELKGSRNSHA
jgi:RNA polymerase sigma-70 factor (ECF subfamily)